MKKEDLYREAWRLWGANAQMDVLIEEMAELTQAIIKARRRDQIWSEEIFEEIADVLICLEQVETRMKALPTDIDRKTNDPTGYLFDIVEEIKAGKLARLEEQIREVKKNLAATGDRASQDKQI